MRWSLHTRSFGGMLSNLANEFGDGRPVSIATSFIERPQIMDSFMGLPSRIVNIANHKTVFSLRLKDTNSRSSSRQRLGYVVDEMRNGLGQES